LSQIKEKYTEKGLNENLVFVCLKDTGRSDVICVLCQNATKTGMYEVV